MATINIPDLNKTITDVNEIKDFLNSKGVWFDQWQAGVAFDSNADQDTILEAYKADLQPFMEANGYKTADVINVNMQTPNLQALREKFLKEHTHTEDEVRFFVDGEGYFWFNLEDNTPIFNVLCQRGDLLSVPAHTKHWFDMGANAFVKAIRIFIDMSGWVPHYTQSRIDEKYNPIY